MAPEQKKRARPISKPGPRAEKRQKIEVPKKHAAVQKRQVTADALPWNEVEMPELFDDAEGFFGLDEVEGVEIVREGGTVRFITTAPKTAGEDEEEFAGFDDEDQILADSAKEGDNEPQAEQTQAEKEAKIKKKQKQREKLKALQEKKKQKRIDAAKQKSQSENATISGGADEVVEEAEEKADEDSTADDDVPSNIFQALEDDAAGDDGVDVSAWADLDLSVNMLSALSKLRFAKPTLIQSATIPEILDGHDMVGKASTGSGKTLAFGIPIVENWLTKYGELDEDEYKLVRPPTALILSPTRELAHQLTEHITNLCKGLPVAPWVASVTGGLSLQKQQRQLTKADIIIGTPGRLWEVMSTSIELSASFKKIQFLVVDEADRLLSQGHFKEVEQILEALDRQIDVDEDDEETLTPRQTLVFSATFQKGLQQKLAGKGRQGLSDDKESMEYLLQKLKFREEKPKFIDVNPASQMAENLKEGMVECAGTEKDLYLYSLLMHHPNQRTLIFTNSIHSVRRLVPLLQHLNLPVLALHSQMIQKARLRSIERFSSSTHQASILVATDVAARGLDIGGVQLVIHYHLPRSADMYVHRSGRTARAGASGSSILLCAPEEVVGTRRLVAKVHAQHAAQAGGNLKKSKYYIRSLDIDRKVVSRLKPRVTLAKKIADSSLAKEKKGHDDDWLKNAAEELGVDYDSDEFNAQGGGQKGRGTGRRNKEKEARALTKSELGTLRGELKALLAQRVNVGVSETYITGGRVDIHELLKGQKGEFLGNVSGIGMDDE